MTFELKLEGKDVAASLESRRVRELSLEKRPVMVVKNICPVAASEDGGPWCAKVRTRCAKEREGRTRHLGPVERATFL